MKIIDLNRYFIISIILSICSVSSSHAGECIGPAETFANTIQTSDNLEDIEYAIGCIDSRFPESYVIPKNILDKWLSSNNINFKILGLRHIKGHLSDPRYVDIVFQYTKDPDPRLRAVAAQMLSFVKNKQSLDLLIELTKDEARGVVEQSIASLLKVGIVDKDRTIQRTREMFRLLSHKINDKSDWYLLTGITDLLNKYGTETEYKDFVNFVRDRLESHSVPQALQICKLNYDIRDMIYPLLMDKFPSEPNLECKASMLDCLIDQMSLVAGKEEFVEEDLTKFPKRYLQYLRNSIFARHGKKFESQSLKAYFSLKSWYKPNSAYTDRMLNNLEKKNIAKIKRIELEEKTYQKELEALMKGKLKTFVHEVDITGHIRNLKFIPKSNTLVFSEAQNKGNYNDWNLWFIDIMSGKVTMKLDGCGEYFDFSNDGKYLITTHQFISNNVQEQGQKFNLSKGFLFKNTTVYNLYEKKIYYTIPYFGKIFPDIRNNYFFILGPFEDFKTVSLRDGKVVRRLAPCKEFYFSSEHAQYYYYVFFENDKAIIRACEDTLGVHVCEINSDLCAFLSLKEILGGRINYYLEFVQNPFTNEILISTRSKIPPTVSKGHGITVRTVNWAESLTHIKFIRNDLIIGVGNEFSIYKIENESIKRLWSSRDIVLRYHIVGLEGLENIFDMNIDKRLIFAIEGQKKIRLIKIPEDIFSK